MVRKNICCTVAGLAMAVSLAVAGCSVSVGVGDKGFTNRKGSVAAQEDTCPAGPSAEEGETAEDAGQGGGWAEGQAEDQDAWGSWGTADMETSEDAEPAACPYTATDSGLDVRVGLHGQGPRKTIKMSNGFEIFYNGPEMELEPAEGGGVCYQEGSKAFGVMYLDDEQAAYVALGLALSAGPDAPPAEYQKFIRSIPGLGIEGIEGVKGFAWTDSPETNSLVCLVAGVDDTGLGECCLVLMPCGNGQNMLLLSTKDMQVPPCPLAMAKGCRFCGSMRPMRWTLQDGQLLIWMRRRMPRMSKVGLAVAIYGVVPCGWHSRTALGFVPYRHKKILFPRQFLGIIKAVIHEGGLDGSSKAYHKGQCVFKFVWK